MLSSTSGALQEGCPKLKLHALGLPRVLPLWASFIRGCWRPEEPQEPRLVMPSPEGAQATGLRSGHPPVAGGYPGRSLGTEAGPFPGGWAWRVEAHSGNGLCCPGTEVSRAAATDTPPPFPCVSPCCCRSVSSVSGKTSQTRPHSRRHFQRPQAARNLGCHLGRWEGPLVSCPSLGAALP